MRRLLSLALKERIVIELHCIEALVNAVRPERVFAKTQPAPDGYVIWVSRSKASQKSRVFDRLKSSIQTTLSSMGENFEISVRTGPAMAELRVKLK